MLYVEVLIVVLLLLATKILNFRGTVPNPNSDDTRPRLYFLCFSKI